jgi:3-hydroxyisobutyrate dehydrogenase
VTINDGTINDGTAGSAGAAGGLPRVAVLGLGIMGAGMAANLVGAGLPTVVWNRGAGRTGPLEQLGATAAADPAIAVADADVVITMLAGAPSVAEVMTAAAPGLRPGQIWLQTSTVGVPGAGHLAELAAAHEVTYVDAPVLGTRGPAEAGTLLVLAAGPPEVRDRLAPVLDAVATRVRWVGDTGMSGAASKLKLVVNSWALNLVSAVGELVSLAEGLGLDPQLALDALAGGVSDAPYLRLKAGAIMTRQLRPDFSARMAAKDAGLIMDAATAAGITLDLVAAAAQRLGRAIEQGHGDDDVAAGYFASFPPVVRPG